MQNKSNMKFHQGIEHFLSFIHFRRVCSFPLSFVRNPIDTPSYTTNYSPSPPHSPNSYTFSNSLKLSISVSVSISTFACWMWCTNCFVSKYEFCHLHTVLTFGDAQGDEDESSLPHMDHGFHSKLPPGILSHGLPNVKEIAPAITPLEKKVKEDEKKPSKCLLAAPKNFH